MKPVAIVTPWFGQDLKGGAEQQAWQIATRLARRGHKVEVLTTCCRSFQDSWTSNHFRAGVTKEQGLKIRRFRVDRSNQGEFDRVNALLLSLPASDLKPGVNPVSPDEAARFCSENINSAALLKFLKEQQRHYQSFLFLPYLYGPILNGLPLVAAQAFLQPCLHNEVYAYLPQVADIVYAAKGLLFISEGEAQLAERLFGAGIIPKSTIAGAGIEVGQSNDKKLELVDRSLKEERFVLCLGRRDPTKNTDLLVKSYAIFKQQHPDSDLKLVLAGSGNQSFHNHVPGVVDLGLVKESQKEFLLSTCLALFQPSQNESYSRVMMEAWFYQRPVAVHGSCLATAIAVERAQAGWLARTEAEWADLFAKLDASETHTLTALGARGQAYATENAAWDRVIERYETALGLTATSPPVLSPQTRRLKEIHQLLPNLAYGDAISNHTLSIRDYLRSAGYKSDIFIRYVDERVSHEARLFKPNCIAHQAGLIYHHSIGSELTDCAIAHTGPKCLIYHNITPPEFFQPYRPEFAKILEQGRAELKQLAQHFPLSVGDSAYNAEELKQSGFAQPDVLPILVHPSKWNRSADPDLMQTLQDGKANLLFVGRSAPNKRQDHLLQAFAHYLTMDREARLILVGSSDATDPYYTHLIHTIQRLNLQEFVVLPGQVNDSQLLAFYRTADLFWSMSEHEGFCVPLIEAMWFDIPVLAYKSSAVPETLGEGGLMFTSKENLVQVAALAKLLIRNPQLREKVLNAQKKRRQFFLSSNLALDLDRLISKMEWG